VPVLSLDWDQQTYRPLDEAVQDMPGVSFVSWRNSDNQELPMDPRLFVVAESMERHTMRFASVAPRDGSDASKGFRLARRWLIRALVVLDQSHKLQNTTWRDAFQAPDDGLVLQSDASNTPRWLTGLPSWQTVGGQLQVTYAPNSVVLAG
jgi:hypothetical protein